MLSKHNELCGQKFVLAHQMLSKHNELSGQKFVLALI
jgi:hypothetical protein